MSSEFVNGDEVEVEGYDGRYRVVGIDPFYANRIIVRGSLVAGSKGGMLTMLPSQLHAPKPTAEAIFAEEWEGTATGYVRPNVESHPAQAFRATIARLANGEASDWPKP